MTLLFRLIGQKISFLFIVVVVVLAVVVVLLVVVVVSFVWTVVVFWAGVALGRSVVRCASVFVACGEGGEPPLARFVSVSAPI